MNFLKLEQYYCGDDAWEKFASYYGENPDSPVTSELIKALNGDVLLAKTIEWLMGGGEYPLLWIKIKNPGLDDLRPIDCLYDNNYLRRLRVLLMRMW